MISKSNEFLYDNKCSKYSKIKDSLKRILFFFADANRDLENPKYNKSKILLDAYEKLNWHNEENFDVICSFWSTFQALLAITFNNMFRFDSGIFKYKNYFGWTPIGKVALCKKFTDNGNKNCRPLLEKIPYIEDLYEFAALTHSVANFVPCINSEFNQVKGIHSQIRDYLPMMVNQIQKWKDDYEAELDNQIIYKYSICVNNNTDYEKITVQMVKEWHQWLVDNCERYCLSMYYLVDCAGENARIEGIPLFSGQSLNNPVPTSETEVLECIRNMRKCIEQRAEELS